jgi:NAD-dependent dihydropyrimidine dehydrogenase PreA subunit
MAVTINKETCTACEACVSECPSEAIKMDETAVIDADACIDCGVCVEACPVEAIAMD